LLLTPEGMEIGRKQLRQYTECMRKFSQQLTNGQSVGRGYVTSRFRPLATYMEVVVAFSAFEPLDSTSLLSLRT
jgi:hypothetical protein